MRNSQTTVIQGAQWCFWRAVIGSEGAPTRSKRMVSLAYIVRPVRDHAQALELTW